MNNNIPIGTRVDRDLYERMIQRSESIRAETGIQLTISALLRAVLAKEFPAPRAPARKKGRRQ
jgi:hypothetical protein